MNGLESNGYWQYCEACGASWKHLDDYCPECGSGLTEEGHLHECECIECVKRQAYYDKAKDLQLAGVLIDLMSKHVNEGWCKTVENKLYHLITGKQLLAIAKDLIKMEKLEWDKLKK